MTLRSIDHDDYCPVCRAHFEAASSLDDPLAELAPGVAMICLYCHSINMMGDDMRLRVATPGEYMEVMSQPDAQRILWGMNQLGPPTSRR